MKTIQLVLIAVLTFLTFSTATASQLNEPAQRQKVYSIIKQAQTDEWFEEQAKLWGTHLQAQPDDADAWLNYYTACRMLKIQAQTKTQDDLDKIVAEMEKSIPESFEFHYVTYWNGGASESERLFHHLEKAYELAPHRPETFDDFLTHYELQRNTEQVKSIALSWFASNDMSAGLYAWNYNMLASCDADAILLTVGDNDTYPALVLQAAKGLREDVILMNIYLLLIDSYRDEYFNELGIPHMDKAYEDFGSQLEFQRAICEHLSEHADRSIYFSVAANPELYKPFKQNIYNVGMALKWSDEEFDNIAVMKRNYEHRFLLDNLRMDLRHDISAGVVNHMNTNYLVSMLTLYNHYKESEDVQAQTLRDLIDRVATNANMKDKVSAILDDNKEHASMVVDDPRMIMKKMAKVNDSLYASKFEISVEMYDLFLTDLLKQRRFDELDIAKNPSVNWRALLPEDKKSIDMDSELQNWHPASGRFPVVNVTYEAAQLYCRWLTETYNKLDHRKKQFDRVEFRLPTENEWEYLAMGGEESSAYAWGGPYVRNAKGCFLGNLDVSDVPDEKGATSPEECPNCQYWERDGGYFPVVTGSYMPNDFGLFNMTGNVSEMVAEKGISKGGSWNTKAGVATINNHETYSGRSAEVGFRVIMIVK